MVSNTQDRQDSGWQIHICPLQNTTEWNLWTLISTNCRTTMAKQDFSPKPDPLFRSLSSKNLHRNQSLHHCKRVGKLRSATELAIFLIEIYCENAPISKLHLHKLIIYQLMLGIKKIVTALAVPSDHYVLQKWSGWGDTQFSSLYASLCVAQGSLGLVFLLSILSCQK